MQLQMRWVILEDANRAIIVVAAMRVVSDTVREIKYQILQLIFLRSAELIQGFLIRLYRSLHLNCDRPRVQQRSSAANMKSGRRRRAVL